MKKILIALTLIGGSAYAMEKVTAEKYCTDLFIREARSIDPDLFSNTLEQRGIDQKQFLSKPVDDSDDNTGQSRNNHSWLHVFILYENEAMVRYLAGIAEKVGLDWHYKNAQGDSPLELINSPCRNEFRDKVKDCLPGAKELSSSTRETQAEPSFDEQEDDRQVQDRQTDEVEKIQAQQYFNQISAFLRGESNGTALRMLQKTTELNVFNLLFQNKTSGEQVVLGDFIESIWEGYPQDIKWQLATIIGPYAYKKGLGYPFFDKLFLAVVEDGAPKELLLGFKDKVWLNHAQLYRALAMKKDPAQKDTAEWLLTNFTKGYKPDKSDQGILSGLWGKKGLYAAGVLTVLAVMWRYLPKFMPKKKNDQGPLV